MSQPLKNWKAAAFQALADYYKVEAERASFEERLEQAQKAAERAGVSWRYGSPSVELHEEAHGCACGAVIVRHYGEPIPVHCKACIEKTRAAVEADAAEEALRAKVEKPGDAHPPGPVSPPPTPRPVEDIPF